MVLIQCRSLTYGYNGCALTEPLNFSVTAGDYLCIVGENGAGKSTLVKTILNLHKPLSGDLELCDELKKTGSGYLPQHTLSQRDFPASVEEIVLSGCQSRCGLRPYYNMAERQLAEKSMSRMGILELRKKSYSKLSGGQQQRVLLARSLCSGRTLLILDEPAAGLDPKVTKDLYALVADLNRKEGMTIIMVSHDLKSALTYASHILHLGKRTFWGTTDAYLASETGRSFISLEGA